VRHAWETAAEVATAVVVAHIAACCAVGRAERAVVVLLATCVMEGTHGLGFVEHLEACLQDPC